VNIVYEAAQIQLAFEASFIVRQLYSLINSRLFLCRSAGHCLLLAGFFPAGFHLPKAQSVSGIALIETDVFHAEHHSA
jgi:hypothetical protein